MSLQAGIIDMEAMRVTYANTRAYKSIHVYVGVYSSMHKCSRIMSAGDQRIHDCLCYALWSLTNENMNLSFASLLIQIPSYPYSDVGHDVSCLQRRGMSVIDADVDRIFVVNRRPSASHRCRCKRQSSHESWSVTCHN